MKTTRVLTAVSAAALLGISSFALAQGTGTGATQRQQDPPPAGSMSKDSTTGDRTSPSQAQKDQGKEGTKANQAQGKDTQKSTTQSQSGQMGKDTQKSTTQSQSGQMGKETQKSNQAQDRAPGAADSKSQMSQEGKEGAKSGATVGAAGSGAVNLTTEQRTTIRQEVLTSNAPRATNINFQVNVGTVVPSTVRVVEVPTTIVKIHPRWKGYRYFVYNDEIIIVEPRTLKIVAVLDV